MSSQVKIFLGVVIILILGTVAVALTKSSGGTPPAAGYYDDFAKCIANSGAKFYGAFWCENCQAQKKEFGSAEKYLPYIECSNPNAQGQTAVCREKNISRYPTWEFKDGSVLIGVQPLANLSEKTSCPLPSSPGGQAGSPAGSSSSPASPAR